MSKTLQETDVVESSVPPPVSPPRFQIPESPEEIHKEILRMKRSLPGKYVILVANMVELILIAGAIGFVNGIGGIKIAKEALNGNVDTPSIIVWFVCLSVFLGLTAWTLNVFANKIREIIEIRDKRTACYKVLASLRPQNF